MTPVAIVGAGLTGMSAAIELRRAGVPHRLFERLAWPGGHAVTREEKGYRFDRTGHLLHLRDPELRQRVIGWLNGDYVEVQRRSRVWSFGRYTRYPFQANTFGLPPEIAFECVKGFIDAHFAAPGPEPSNFEEFCLQHFGPGISKHFMIPYNARLWGVPPREITSAWCQRFVPLPKLDDVIAGAVGKNDRELGYNTSFIYPRLGIGELSRAMQRELPALELERAPSRIDWRNKQLYFGTEAVGYDVLLNTAPLPKLVELLLDAPEQVSAAARRLRCTHLYYLDVALTGPCGQDLHWVYVPEAKYPFYRVGCYTNFSAALAPAGAASLYVELADRRTPDVQQLLPEVARGLIEMQLIRSSSEIAFASLQRIDHAYVIFDHAYFEATETLRDFFEQQRILSVGRYGAWNYSSMEDALLFGRDAARRAQALLE
jgi:protoporphyrinogen oxidase